MISSNYWYLSEHLINAVLPIFLLIIAITLFILLGLSSSTKNKKRIFKSILIIIVTSCAITIGIFVYTTDYRQLYPFEINANRKTKMAILHYEKRANDTSNNANLYDINKTLNLPFYEKKTITETNSLSYLGKNDAFYFFTDDKVIYQLDLSNDVITFQPIKQVSIIKEYAELTDNTFKKINFKEKVGPAISSITVPIEKQTLVYEPNTTTYDLIK